MNTKNNTALIILLAISLTGCLPNPGTKPDESAGSVTPVMASEAEAPTTVAQPNNPAPELPAWAAEMVGTPLQSLFPDIVAECMGGADIIGARFNSPTAFARIDGWAWNVRAGAPYDRLIGVDDSGIIIGAGSSVYERPDVLGAHPETVTDAIVGYHVQVSDTGGRVRIFALEDGLPAACYVGEITL